MMILTSRKVPLPHPRPAVPFPPRPQNRSSGLPVRADRHLHARPASRMRQQPAQVEQHLLYRSGPEPGAPVCLSAAQGVHVPGEG